MMDEHTVDRLTSDHHRAMLFRQAQD